MAAPFITPSGIGLLGLLSTSAGILIKFVSLQKKRETLRSRNYFQQASELEELKKKKSILIDRKKQIENLIMQEDIEINKLKEEQSVIIKNETRMRLSCKKGFALYDLLSTLNAQKIDVFKDLLIRASKNSISKG